MPEGLPPTEFALLSDFEDHLALERRLSPNTVAAYRGDLEQLATFLARNHTSLGDAPYPILRRFLAQQHTLGYAGRRSRAASEPSRRSIGGRSRQSGSPPIHPCSSAARRS